MQLDLSDKSQITLQKLKKILKRAFDLSIEGPRLRPTAFVSRYCKDYKVNCHGFVGGICQLLSFIDFIG